MEKLQNIKTEGKIDLGQGTLYTLEAPGGIVGFDMTDPHTIDRLYEMYDLFEKAEKKYRADLILIEKKNDQTVDKLGVPNRNKKELKAYKEYMNGIFKAIDAFFGEGASEKIFYNEILGRVIVSEFSAETLLVDILPEHFERAGLKVEKQLEKRLEKRGRFVRDNKEVIDLDDKQAE